MECGNAIGLPGATLAHCNEIMIFNKLLIDRLITAPELPSAIIHNGYRPAPV
jgi:hypothetical protein